MDEDRKREFYPKLNPLKDEEFIPINVEKISYGRLVLAIFIGVILGIAGLLTYGYYFPTTTNNETLLNNTFNYGSAFGYQTAIYDVSVLVLQNNTLPVFTNATGEITIQYLDLIKYYQEVNQNG